MKVHAVDPEVDIGTLLAGAQFTDAFSMTVDEPALDARMPPSGWCDICRDGSAH